MKKIIRYIVYGLQIKLQSMVSIFSSFYMKTWMFLSGVSLGSGALFFGKTYIKFHPTSTISIGNNCSFRSSFTSNTIGLKQNCFLSTGRDADLSIGKLCGLSGTVISAEKSISIGDRVYCGANVTICDSDRHPIDPILRNKGHKGEISPVIIEDDVWIGMNTIVLKGVTIGKNTVIGANSVVNKSLPANVIAAGVPAKVIKVLNIKVENVNL